MTPDSERDLIPVISRLARRSKSTDEAMELFQPVLAGQIGGATLILDPVDEGISTAVSKSIAAFMDSREFPFRGLYTAPLIVGNRKVGRLIACFGSFGAPVKSLPVLTAHVARQLSEIMNRTGRVMIRPAIDAAAVHPEAA